MSDALATLLSVNLVVAAAVGLVMALRLRSGEAFGPRIAYGLWIAGPPGRPGAAGAGAGGDGGGSRRAAGRPDDHAPMAMAGAPAAPSLLPLVVALWVAGGLFSLARLVWRQAQFGRAARDGLAGPAVVGLLRPRIVTPFDFVRRYTPREQGRGAGPRGTHIQRRDTLANAAVASGDLRELVQTRRMHVFARYLRIDQEFACDAQVIAAYPKARRVLCGGHAEDPARQPRPAAGLLLARAVRAPAGPAHIELLARRGPRPRRRRMGMAVVRPAGARRPPSPPGPLGAPGHGRGRRA